MDKEEKQMVKCDKKYLCFKYYNDDNEHKFIDMPTYNEASIIIHELMVCPQFQCDSTILNSLYMAMRKLQGFSDKDIQRLME